jgi:hypothetical protein
LVQAGCAIEIEILDHVIIGRPDQHNADGFIDVCESGMVDFAAS